MRLMREVRCSSTAERGGTGVAPVSNQGRPPQGCPNDLATFQVVRAVVEGAVDEPTGFLCNVKRLDGMLRDVVLPGLCERAKALPHEVVGPGLALLDAFPRAAGACPALVSLKSLELRVSPFMSFAVEEGARTMIRLTRSFEFSASHRLYRAGLSEEENLRVFGKCSNPHGHGHNYVLEVTVSGTPDEVNGTLIDPPRFDRVVKERVIDYMDHRNLNVECGEFSSLNPSVENIARVIWNRLEGAFTRCTLTSVRVWETPKTYAEYTGGE